MCVVLLTAPLLLCSLLETDRCNDPGLPPGPGVSESQGWRDLGSNWGKRHLFFLLVLLKNS